LKEKDIPHSNPSGLKVLVDGRVPTGNLLSENRVLKKYIGSGLSSSSALVCASALAILAADGLIDKVNKADIAEFTCSCERHSGTESGGMDQAISIMAKEGFAKLIDFNPVRSSNINRPPSSAFRSGEQTSRFLPPACLSLETRWLCPTRPRLPMNGILRRLMPELGLKCTRRYNLRVVECRIAVMVLAKALGLPKEQFSKLRILREIQDLPDLKDMARTLLGEIEDDSSMSICLRLVQTCLKKDVYSLQEVPCR